MWNAGSLLAPHESRGKFGGVIFKTSLRNKLLVNLLGAMSYFLVEARAPNSPTDTLWEGASYPNKCLFLPASSGSSHRWAISMISGNRG